MQKCARCREKAIISLDKPFCRRHFILEFEKKVDSCIKTYKLASKHQRIMVACSGGKDSTTVLYLLKKFGYKVSALAIDEGISGYRNKTLADLKLFCKANKVRLKVASFKEEFGFSLDKALRKRGDNPCTTCGVLRRYMLNKHSRGFDRIATGHNLDDEAQSILMNFFTANLKVAARLGPITGVVRDAKFTPRIKPLYFCSEREVAAYSFIMDFGVGFSECPYAGSSFRATIRDLLNGYESKHPGTKLNIVKAFIAMLPGLRRQFAPQGRVAHCPNCGEPTEQAVCKACQLI